MLYACKYASAAGRKALSSIYFELADYDDTRWEFSNNINLVDRSSR